MIQWNLTFHGLSEESFANLHVFLVFRANFCLFKTIFVGFFSHLKNPLESQVLSDWVNQPVASVFDDKLGNKFSLPLPSLLLIHFITMLSRFGVK